MEDDEWRFWRWLGLIVLRRLDWWKIKGEMTPYEAALQLAAERLDPMGPQRFEIFMSRIAVRQLAGNSELSADEEFENIRYFLPIDRQEEKTLTPEQAEEERKRINGHCGRSGSDSSIGRGGLHHAAERSHESSTGLQPENNGCSRATEAVLG